MVVLGWMGGCICVLAPFTWLLEPKDSVVILATCSKKNKQYVI